MARKIDLRPVDILTFAVVTTLLTLLVIAETHRRRDHARLRAHCAIVHESLLQDLRAFQDPSQQEAAAARFTIGAGRSLGEIQLCTSSMPDLQDRDRCRLEHNLPCLTQLAAIAARAVGDDDE